MKKEKPNFLFITTDQQRWDTVGIHNPVLKTPNMDRLAQDGMQFDRMYPTNAICMPARASMITGRSQRGHQVFNHNVNLSEAIPVLGDSLQDAGYGTALIGKAHFKTADFEDVLPDQPPEGAKIHSDGTWHGPYYGFEYIDLHTGHAYPAGHWRLWLEHNHPEGLKLWRNDHRLEEGTGAFQSWKNALPAEWHYTHWTGQRTVDWLQKRNRDQPFFLWMSFADPHQPFAPPKPYCDMYDPNEMPEPFPSEDVSNKPPHYQWAQDGKPYGGYDTTSGWGGEQLKEIVAHYYGLTSFIDDAMGQVFDELDRQGLWENTHVIFTSDHGEGLKDHGIAAKPMMSYECVNRVPFFWHHPSVSATVYDGVMTQLDLTPTFLDLADADPVMGMEGLSFAPVLTQESDVHRDAVIVERISVLGENEVMKVKMLVTKDWKMLHYGSAPYGELYNVKNDPEDLHNLWDVSDYADVRQQLTERLLAELIDSELGDPKVVLKAKGVGGTLRAQKCMEQEPEYRGDLSDRLDGIRNLNRSK
jgi:arylsulfatase A-like enzyme